MKILNSYFYRFFLYFLTDKKRRTGTVVIPVRYAGKKWRRNLWYEDLDR